MRSVIVLLAAGLLATLLAAVSAKPAEAGRSECWTQPSTTVLRSGEVRVFTRLLRSPVLEGRENRLFGCHYRTKRAYSLREKDDYCGVTSIERRSLRLAGRFVAYVQRACSVENYFPVVTVRNLATGRIVVRQFGGENAGGIPSVASIVVKRNGTVAWIAAGAVPVREPGRRARATNLVYVADARGRRLVAEGAGVELGSLALSADSAAITFTQDGERRTLPIE